VKAILLGATKRERLERMLKLQYGIDCRLPSTLIQSGAGKIRIATPEAFEAAQLLRGVHSVGLYVVKVVDGTPVLSIEGTHLFCREIRQNVMELSHEQSDAWMSASPVQLKTHTASKYVAARSGPDCLGCGRTSGPKVFPYVPRWRRIVPQSRFEVGGPQRKADGEDNYI